MKIKSLFSPFFQKYSCNSITLLKPAPKEMSLVTLEELWKEFTQTLEEAKWSREDIQVFFDSHLLLGKYRQGRDGDINALQIERESFMKLCEYLGSLNELKDKLKNHQD